MSKDNNNLEDRDMSNYNLDEDKKFKTFLRKKKNELSDKTIHNYRGSIQKFCQYHKETFKEMVEKFEKEQNTVEYEEIGEGKYLKHDFKIEDSLIAEYQEDYIDYLQKKGLKNKTINNYVKDVKAVFNSLGIKTPVFKKLETDESDWELLTRKDLKYALDSCTIHYKAFMTFAISTGFRMYDCLSLTIDDFIKATYDYHGVRELDEFLEKVEGKEIMGTWKIIPHKTRKLKIKQITYNSPESSEFIIRSLKDRIRFMERKNKDKGTDLKLQKTDSLFASKRLDYKKAPLDTSVDGYFRRKSLNLREKRTQELKNKLEEGTISQETYDEDIKRIPTVRPHMFRKYYISVINRHTPNIRISGTMEGHKTGLPTDNAYIKIFDEDIKKTYESALPELTISSDNISYSKEIKELKKQHQQEMEILKKEFEKQLTEKDKEVEKKLAKKDTEIAAVKASHNTLQNQMGSMQNQIDNISNEKNITRIIEAIAENKTVKERNLQNKITDLYKEDFKNGIVIINNDYIEELISRAYNQSLSFDEVVGNYEEPVAPPGDKRMEKIQEITNDAIELYMGNTDYMITDNQRKKIHKKIQEYENKVYLAEEEANLSDAEKIIRDILMNG